MEFSHRFFENRSCQYYPCHQKIATINCLFCFCPMYQAAPCLGTPTWKEKDGRTIKVCTNCTFPHQPEHYDAIMAFLKTMNTRRI